MGRAEHLARCTNRYTAAATGLWDAEQQDPRDAVPWETGEARQAERGAPWKRELRTSYTPASMHIEYTKVTASGKMPFQCALCGYRGQAIVSGTTELNGHNPSADAIANSVDAHLRLLVDLARCPSCRARRPGALSRIFRISPGVGAVGAFTSGAMALMLVIVGLSPRGEAGLWIGSSIVAVGLAFAVWHVLHTLSVAEARVLIFDETPGPPRDP